jgi:heme exporter protein C
MIYRVFLILLSAAATVAYVLAPPGAGFQKPESARILFFHVPEAMLCTFFFIWGAIMGVRYLLSGRNGVGNTAFDIRALASIEVGTILCILATTTGMVFAYEQWGVAWDWDPRQVTILMQLLIYAAYFALRAGFVSRERSAANSAAYSVFAGLTVPFLIWVLPRLPQFQTKHSGANKAVIGGNLDQTYGTLFALSVLTIGLVALWCYKLRVSQLTREEEKTNEAASVDSADTGVVRPVRIRDLD